MDDVLKPFKPLSSRLKTQQVEVEGNNSILKDSARTGSENSTEVGCGLGTNLENKRYARFEALWRIKTKKKHKTWHGDGVATYHDEILSIESENNILFRLRIGTIPSEGDFFAKGVYEIEIGAELSIHSVPKLSSETNNEGKRRLCENQPLKIAFLEQTSNFGQMVRRAPNTTLARSRAPQCNEYLPDPTHKNFKGFVSKLTPGLEIGTFRSASEVFSQKPASDQPISPDTLIKHNLRPHQIEAFVFLRDCILGTRHSFGKGAILADEMGLGKTLTSIALVLTLIKRKVIKNVLIACPATLISNWQAEFRKWIGDDQLGVYALTPERNVCQFFRADNKVYQVLLASYERLRNVTEEMDKKREFDLIVCDEGHRLKSSDSKTVQALSEICGEKRILLTGTPYQNNLSEFWALADFVNPGIFGSLARFERKYTIPITAARNNFGSSKINEIGMERYLELQEIVQEIMLRRDQTVLCKYLSIPKEEFVVFCPPTAKQLTTYRSVLLGVDMESGQLGSGFVLQTISKLRQLANSSLLSTEESSEANAHVSVSNSGGKLKFLKAFLLALARNTSEKIVVVSNSTRMLDLCQSVCTESQLSWLRFDGETPLPKRAKIVNIFNRSNNIRSFCLLLSARCGGTGLNLVGASRLILVDSDWNPAVDRQAIARIYRDGQQKPVFVYRLLSTGLIDETIFQRQLLKNGMSGAILNECFHEDYPGMEELKSMFLPSCPKSCVSISDGIPDGFRLAQIQSINDEVLKSVIGACEVSCVLQKENN